MTRIIGIDPGSRKTGFGIIELDHHKARHITHGLLLVGDGGFPARLKRIFDGLTDIIRSFKPDTMAVESVFLHKNADSALKLGQARGSAICAGVNQQLSVHEYSATQIKKSIVGNGHAKKHQVQYMVSVILSLSDAPDEDAADALACAMTHARFMESHAQQHRLPDRIRMGHRRSRYGR